jgi:arginyl-tRNA synthetase
MSAALAAAGGPNGAPAMVAPAARPEFGDYQANGVMPAAKAAKTNPLALAQKVAAAADVSDIAATPLEIAGPGFINIRLKTEWLSEELAKLSADERLGVDRPERPQTAVVDYSSPNLAKEMHVGHLRSTIIGDALARTLEYVGHKVIRQNHVGDWGTQFGMLVAYLDQQEGRVQKEDPDKITKTVHLEDIEEFYREAKQLFDQDPKFADLARSYVVRLQSGDAKVLESWKEFRRLSLNHCGEVYKKLGVELTGEDIRGESFYNDKLKGIVEELKASLGPDGFFKESQGAQCVFLPEFTARDGEPLPLIVQKSDEGYLYATTDLAAMRYRVGELHADRILYVTDSRQTLHFRQVFAVARKAGFVGEGVSLEYVPFGTMMGDDGTPFKTRSGGTVKLIDLLNEAEERAFALVTAKSPELSEERRREVARVVGVGAVKYADLAQNRTSDYVFSWDKMLSMDGNTAPYMQYAYARIRSIFRKGAAADGGAALQSVPITLADPAERTLAVRLLQFPETIDAVAAECLPNILCAYLYELAGAFMSFYESCPVLQSPQPLRASRLRLCDLTARVIKTGLDLLGIQTIEQM